MKKIFLITILFATVVTGCKKGLDPVVNGALTASNFPKSESDFNLLTTEVYKLFSSKWIYSDGGITGNLFYGVEYSNIFLNDYPTDLIAPFPEWGGFFDGFSKSDFNFMKTIGIERNHLEKIRFISKITKIIDDIDKSTINANAKKQFSAEAKAARGILMYNLLTMYGPVPVIVDASKIGTDAEKNMQRLDRAAYINIIATDLRYAADNLPKMPADYGRFNKGCALTFLARLYLNEKDWVKAEATAKEIIPLGYSLVPNYASLFVEATEVNNETIWAVTCDPSGNGDENKASANVWGFYCFPTDFPGNLTSVGGKKVGGWGWPGPFTATWKFYESFDSVDKRRALLIAKYDGVKSDGSSGGYSINKSTGMRGPVIAKYADESPGPFAGNDVPVCRYADILLILAEAINEQRGPIAEAQGFINTVRTRAGIPNLSGADIATAPAFRDAILRERGWELYFEGQRRVDLIRHNKWASTLATVGKTPSPGSALFPVPQYMIDLGMTQTPGY